MCENCGGQSGKGTGLSPSTLIFHQCSTITITYMLLHEKYKGAKPGNLSKSNALVEIEEHWIEKYFHLVIRPQHLPAAIADRRIGKTTILRTAGRPATIRKTSSITCNKHRKLNRNGALSLRYAVA
jgi:hypothetical protein